MIVTTVTGSRYRIDPDAKTWERISKSPESGELRTESGTFYEVYWDFTTGTCVHLICPPIVEGTIYRSVVTSPVVAIEEEPS